MPLYQTGDKGLQLGTVTVNGLSQSPTYTLPSPPPGWCYNLIHLVNAGTVTAAGGVAAGNGAAELVANVDAEWAVGGRQGGKLIDNVRWYALWVVGYSIDSFTPVAATSAGAGGGAYRSEIFIPTIVRTDDVVRFTLTTVAAHATYHTTATAFAGTVTFYADLVPAASGKTNRKRIIYRERVIDALAVSTQVQFSPEVTGYQLFKIGWYSQSARGTLANLWNFGDLLINGRYRIPPATPFATIQAWHAFDYRRTNVVGVAFYDIRPEFNTAADQLKQTSIATAHTATSGIILMYVEP